MSNNIIAAHRRKTYAPVSVEITKIICNRCGKETKVVSGIPKREMLHVEHTWGYFSGKDGESCSFDLCEECFDEITKGFLIPTECKDE